VAGDLVEVVEHLSPKPQNPEFKPPNSQNKNPIININLSSLEVWLK
jgi:hypothetical protein